MPPWKMPGARPRVGERGERGLVPPDKVCRLPRVVLVAPAPVHNQGAQDGSTRACGHLSAHVPKLRVARAFHAVQTPPPCHPCPLPPAMKHSKQPPQACQTRSRLPHDDPVCACRRALLPAHRQVALGTHGATSDGEVWQQAQAQAQHRRPFYSRNPTKFGRIRKGGFHCFPLRFFTLQNHARCALRRKINQIHLL